MYSQSSTTNTYNYLLNGRWHSGTTPDTLGQLDIEHQIIKHAKIDSHSKVLDFGCGNGVVTCDYHILTGAELHGTSNEPSQIQCAQELAKKLNIPVKFSLCTDLLPYGDNVFDVVVFTESLCHLKNKVAIFQEFKRVLKPGGVICGEDWTHLVADGPNAETINNAYHTYMVHPDRYACLSHAAGFRHILTRVITPIWSHNLQTTIINELRLTYYRIMYPLLPLSCPFHVDQSDINYDLVNAGKYIERDSNFRLVIFLAKSVTCN